jgi:hypothetical protein
MFRGHDPTDSILYKRSSFPRIKHTIRSVSVSNVFGCLFYARVLSVTCDKSAEFQASSRTGPTFSERRALTSGIKQTVRSTRNLCRFNLLAGCYSTTKTEISGEKS